MSASNTAEYYGRREQAERALAAKAIDPAIAKIHLELASRYAEQAAATPRSKRPTLHVSGS